MKTVSSSSFLVSSFLFLERIPYLVSVEKLATRNEKLTTVLLPLR